MANEIILSGITPAVAAALGSESLLMLAERGTFLNHPAAAVYCGSINGRATDTLVVPHWGLLGYTTPSTTTSDGAAPSNSALADGESLIVVAKTAKQYTQGDLAKLAMAGILDPRLFAADAQQWAANRATDLTCDVIDGFTAQTGSTGVDLTIAVLVSTVGLVGTLNVDKTGGLCGVLHGQQWADVMDDAVANDQLVAFGQAHPAMTPGMGNYRGRWLNVDWFDSNRVKTANAGADRAGGVWARGGVVWGDGKYQATRPGQAVLSASNIPGGGGNILFAEDRNESEGSDSFISHFLLGVSKGLECGATVISDA